MTISNKIEYVSWQIALINKILVISYRMKKVLGNHYCQNYVRLIWLLLSDKKQNYENSNH
jgi:hypothetical protein